MTRHLKKASDPRRYNLGKLYKDTLKWCFGSIPFLITISVRHLFNMRYFLDYHFASKGLILPCIKLQANQSAGAWPCRSPVTLGLVR